MRGETAKAEPTIRGAGEVPPGPGAGSGRARSARASEAERAAARAAFEKALEKNPAQLDAIAGLVAMDLQDKRPRPRRPGWTRRFGRSPKDAGHPAPRGAGSYCRAGRPCGDRAIRRARRSTPTEQPRSVFAAGQPVHPSAARGRGDPSVLVDRREEPEIRSGAYTILGMLLSDAEQAGGSARTLREGARRRPTRRGCRQQPGRNLHGYRRQSGHRASAREDREGGAAGSVRDQRHARDGPSTRRASSPRR